MFKFSASLLPGLSGGLCKLTCCICFCFCLFVSFFFFFFCGFIYLSGFLFISVTSICASYLFLVADSCIHCCLLSCCTCKYGRMSRREGVYQQDVPPK